MDVDIKVTGMDECMARLKTMSQEFAARTLIGGAYSAMLPMEHAIENAAPVRTGTLKKSIARKKIVRSSDESITVMIGVNKRTVGADAKGRKVWPVKYAHLVEKNKHFMRNAYEATAPGVVDRYIKVLDKKLKKAGA